MSARNLRRNLRRNLLILTALGLLGVLLSGFLWQQLLVARAGGTPTCGFGEEGACGALWDSAIASAVHDRTGVPVAGWGLIWGVVALALPLLALARKGAAGAVAGVKWVALGGLLATVVLAWVSFDQGIFCTGCVGTYVLVLAYTAVALWGLGGGAVPRPAGPGLAWALGATTLAFLALLVPGLHTPKSAQDSLQQAIAQSGPSTPVPDTTPESPPEPTPVPPEPTEESGLEAELNRAIWDFILQLDAPSQQMVADALYVYQTSPIVPALEPRTILGPKDARIRITAFTDIRCPACADFHANLEIFERAVPAGTFSLEPRHFPLDGRCNPLIPRERPEPIRCEGAKALICLESLDEPGVLAKVQGQIFEAQERIDESLLYSFTDPYMNRGQLRRCMASAETSAKLQEDIQWAELHHIRGTPLVLLNGRKASSFGAFLYVVLLNGGSWEHPAFQQLPPPSPRVTG